VITPHFELEKLRKSGAAAIDLRLGCWFTALRPARMSCLRADETASEARLTKASYVPLGSEYFLHPRGFCLGTTLEWLRFPKRLAGYVIGRSSWGRRGLIIATATGVHPGFAGCLTLELSNVGELPVAIKPGTRICQLFLHETTGAGDEVDQSHFLGMTRPVLGRIHADPIEANLGK
jgi:dCTP deaminase